MPKLSLLISAYNEEDVIEGRIENALALDYPRDKFEIIIASDGSTDRTAQIVREYEDRGVRLLDFPHEGKATVLNRAVPLCAGEVVLLSDANTMMQPDVPRRLVAWFSDPDVGVVCGKLILIDPEHGTNCDGAYWRYENFLKACEGRLGALLGATGAIYAIRRQLFEPIPANTTVDDFVVPMSAKERTGCMVVYERNAVAREDTHPEMASEFQRRCRFGASGFQNIQIFYGLLHPRHGWVALTFLSHKVLRWTCPFFLIGALLTNCLLAIISHNRLYLVTLIAQLAFYGTALTLWLLPSPLRLLKPLRLTSLFVSMNVALLVGFWRWVRGTQTGTWKSARSFSADAVSSRTV